MLSRTSAIEKILKGLSMMEEPEGGEEVLSEELPQEGKVVKKVTMVAKSPELTEGLEDSAAEAVDAASAAMPMLKRSPSVMEKMEFDDLSLEDLKKLKLKLAEKGLV